MPITTIKIPSELEMIDLNEMILESNLRADPEIPEERMQRLLSRLNAISEISLTGLMGQELENAKQNLVNVKHSFFISILGIPTHPLFKLYGNKIFTILYNKFELFEYRPNLSLQADPYAGSKLAIIMTIVIITNGVNATNTIKISDEIINITRNLILYGEDIVHALYVLSQASNRTFAHAEVFLFNILPHISKKLNSVTSTIPIVINDKHYDLVKFVFSLRPLNGILEPGSIALAPDGSRVDFREIQFDYKYAANLRKTLRDDNLFKFMFTFCHMYVQQMNIAPLYFLSFTLTTYLSTLMYSSYMNDPAMFARLTAVGVVIYLANILVPLLSARVEIFKEVGIEPKNMIYSPTLQFDMLKSKRAQHNKVLTICFDKFANENKQKSVASENGIIEKILDYSEGKQIPNALKFQKPCLS